jgi:stage IV sporulation protein A
MPFIEAAELGTKKVNNEHSTIGMLISTDGSIGEIPRESYVNAEERVVSELKAIGKPFAMILNSANPSDPKSIALAYELEEKYSAPVALVNCLELDSEDIKNILEMVLCEFPITEIRVKLPGWMQALEQTHPVKKSICDCICKCAHSVQKVGEIKKAFASLSENEFISRFTFDVIDYGSGSAKMSVFCSEELYFTVLSELTGFQIDGEEQLVYMLKEYSSKKNEFDRIAEALNDAEERDMALSCPTQVLYPLKSPKLLNVREGMALNFVQVPSPFT